MTQRLLAIFILTLYAAGQNPSAGTSADPNSKSANSAQARKIVEQCIQALGGKAYLSIMDLKQQGRSFGFDRNGASSGVGAPFTRYYRYPDKERVEYLRNAVWVIIHDGDRGYDTTFRGTRLQDATEISDYNRRRLYALDRVLREWAQDPTTAFFYEGETIAETKQAHQITLMNSKNQGVTLFIDVKTKLPVKKSFTWRDAESREVWEDAELYDKFRPIQGVMTPFLITNTHNGKMNGQRFYSEVDYNPSVDASRFVPPPLHYDRTIK